jgi:hypothetical protein
MILELDIEELLNNKYNIDIEKYWKLPEEEKNNITELLFGFILVMFDNNPSIYTTYMNLLKQSIQLKSEMNEYEKADILTRLKNKILETFVIY